MPKCNNKGTNIWHINLLDIMVSICLSYVHLLLKLNFGIMRYTHYFLDIILSYFFPKYLEDTNNIFSSEMIKNEFPKVNIFSLMNFISYLGKYKNKFACDKRIKNTFKCICRSVEFIE